MNFMQSSHWWTPFLIFEYFLPFFPHTVILSIQTLLHADTHYKESLVWFQARLCYTINAGPLLGFFYTSPVSWRSYSPVSEGLNHLPTPSMLQQIIDEVDVGVGQYITLFLGLGTCRFVSPPALLCLCHQGDLSSFALGTSPLAVINKQWGHFPGFHIFRVGSHTLTLSGPARLCCLGEV